MEYNRLIDHTLLKADATVEQIEKLCKEALQYNFFSVCVNSAFVPLAKSFLEGSDVKVATTIGFPLGASATAVKAFEVEQALKEGADEFDMVINVGWLKSKLYRLVHEDIAEVVKAAGGKVVKVIIETCYLTDDEKKIASSIAAAAGAPYVKTSTGFGTGGATVEDVQLIRSVVGPNIGVKASGGIRDAATLKAMVDAGANRIGASASVKIMEELRIEGN